MADTPSYTLLNNVAVDGPEVSVRRGRYAFLAHGTFGGTTVTLRIKGPNGSGFIDAGAEATLTAAGSCLVDLPDCVVMVDVTGGSPANLYASLSPVS